MPDVVCQNPSCKKVNPSDRIICRYCGWRLAPLAPTPMELPQLLAKNAQLIADHKQLQEEHQLLGSNLAEVQRQMQALEDEHQKLSGAFTEVEQQKQALEDEHKLLNKNLTEVQQQKKALEDQKLESDRARDDLIAQIATLKSQVGSSPEKPNGSDHLIAELRQKLQTSEADAADAARQYKQSLEEKVRECEDRARNTTAGQPPRPLRSRLLSWGLPLVALAAGLLLGINTALNHSRSQANAPPDGPGLEQEKATLSVQRARASSRNYKGPLQGTLVIKYYGRTDKPAQIVVDHFRPVGDSTVAILAISGIPFPSVPLIVEPVGGNVTIVSPPSPANNWQRVTLSVQGRGPNQAVLRWLVF